MMSMLMACSGQASRALRVPVLAAGSRTAMAPRSGGYGIQRQRTQRAVAVRCAAGAAGHAGLREPATPLVFVMGGPGSGKGTQCERLAGDFGLVHLSAGEADVAGAVQLLREHIKSGTESGDRVKAIIDGGNIVPSEITVGLMDEAARAAPGETAGFVVDGFPRNLSNRALFLDMLGRDCTFALIFQVPDDVAVGRLLGRGQGRADDKEEVIKRRLRVYEEDTTPVQRAYEEEGLAVVVDGDRPPEAVYAEVRGLVARRLGVAARPGG